MVRMSLLAVVSVLALGGTACEGSDGDAKAGPNASSPAVSTEPTNPPSDTGSTSAAAQTVIYKEALQRWNDYRRRSASIWSEGRATDDTARVFREYFIDWQQQQSQLEALQQNRITVDGPAPVLWSRSALVTPERVTIEQCSKDAPVYKDGEELPPSGPGHPYVVTVVLSRSVDEEFRIASVTAATDQRCDARQGGHR